MNYINDRNKLHYRVNEISRLDSNERTILAIELFRFQYKYNNIYREYVNLLGVTPNSIGEIKDIPFLPIQLYKNYNIKTGEWNAVLVFESSGTTGTVSSKHPVKDMDLYLNNAFEGFSEFYNNPKQYAYLALLPSYLERGSSSLVAMVDHFIKLSDQESSGFYLYDMDSLNEQIVTNEKNGIPTIVFGVSYALLDFAEQFPQVLKHTMIIETGGMKGKRKELPKKEIHRILKEAFQLQHIHSEYGMTELFSQAYAKENGMFNPISSMEILIRELSDPLTILDNNRVGAINVIDYCNIDSCCFIATEDVGKRYEDGSFELMGRVDVADIRGCNLMVDDLN